MTAALPTLELVAAEAGVSRSTVSRVVNGSPKVKPAVVEAVQEAIARLNYVPNRAARTLVSRQTQALALLVPEDVTRFFGDPYFASVVKGLTKRLEPTNYILNLLVASSDPTRKTQRYLRGGNVDGALVVSHHIGDSDLTGLSATMPVVFGGRPTSAQLGPGHFVDVDNVGGGRQAARHLIEQGRHCIGTVAGPVDMPAAVDRLTGWRSALREAGLADDAVVHGDFTLQSGAMAMADLLARTPALDAVFVASDLMARGALATLAAYGRSVPRDVAVVGYDDSTMATSAEPRLTTVAQPAELMGTRMAEVLLEVLSGTVREDGPIILATRLVVRDTA
jgi:DNA-binding LacI/PurR family transcriptional regulator